MFVNIMVSVRTLENEIKFRKFDTTFRRERSTHPHLQDMLTSYAYNHLMSEWASVHLYVCYESNEPTSDSVVQKAATPSASEGDLQPAHRHPMYFVNTEQNSCSCSTYKSKKLPCVHLLAARQWKQVVPMLSHEMFHRRWLQEENPIVEPQEVNLFIGPTSSTPSATSQRSRGQPDNIRKYSIAKVLLTTMVDRLSSVGSEKFHHYVDVLKKLDEAMANHQHVYLRVQGASVLTQGCLCVIIWPYECSKLYFLQMSHPKC
jgi:hypothetical protein